MAVTKECQELNSIIGLNDPERMRIVGSSFNGFVTTAMKRKPKNSNVNCVEVTTVSPTGVSLFWSFEEKIPHKFDLPSIKGKK